MKRGLNIIVCVKQVPETVEVEIDADTGRLMRERYPGILNPFDEHAVEEALRLKERYGGFIKVLTMGPPMAEKTLRDALAMGCDEAWLATDIAFAGADTLATSYTLSLCIERIKPYDLIICGMKTTDGDTGQVGPELAEHLGIPHICYVSQILEITQSRIKVKRRLDDGIETLKAPLPALITVTKEINQPRLPTLTKRLKAKRAQIMKLKASDLGGEHHLFGVEGSPTKVMKVFRPQPPKGGEILRADPKTSAEKILEKLRECRVV